MDSNDNIVVLRTQGENRSDTDDPILAAVRKLKDQPLRQVNWPAVATFMAISMAAMLGSALVPETAGNGLKWAAAMGLMIGTMACGVAVLYRHVPGLWVVRKPKAPRVRSEKQKRDLGGRKTR
jgi:hypothetical protein